MGQTSQRAIKSAQHVKNDHLDLADAQRRHFINFTLVLTPYYGILTTSTNNLGREK